MKSNLKTLDQLIEETYGKLGSPSRNKFEWGAQLFKISALIKIARHKLQLTQKEFAIKCGTSKYAISIAENLPSWLYPSNRGWHKAFQQV